MADDDARQTGDSQLFAIFLFAILFLVTLPLTWWRVASGGGAATTVLQPWQKKETYTPSFSSRLKRYANRFNIGLLCAWLAIIALGLYIATLQPRENEPFDPFVILGISETADLKQIKRAYRDMSKIYHPDKNPDPAAATFFAEKITKAYQTLTDDTARANWVKHGHPDGPQSMNIGVALPEWIFASDRRTAPLVLLALVFLGLAVPILAVAGYLWQTEGFVGSNQVMEQTLFMYHRYSVKELLRVTKMPEAIVPANEFIMLPLKRETIAAFQKFSQVMARTYNFSKDDKKIPKWWRPELLRTYFFIVAHLDRNTGLVPAELHRDFEETLRLVPIMCEEFVKAACAARNRLQHGWFLPAEAAVQFQQCVVQQVRPEVRCPSAEDRKKRKAAVGEAAAALLQLPGLEEETVRNLEKKARVKTLEDLAMLPAAERAAALEAAGVQANMHDDVAKTLLSLPHAHVTSVHAFVEGEADIKESDVVTVRLHLAVTRPSQFADDTAAAPRAAAAGVQAYAPRFPHPVTEKWYVFVADTKAATPSTWCHQHVVLAEAELAGYEHRARLGCKWQAGGSIGGHITAGSSAAGSAEGNGTDCGAAEGTYGQKVEFKFLVVEAGQYDLQVVVMPSCWIGCDVTVPLSLTVLKQSAAEKQGRGAARGKGAKAIPLDADEVEQEEAAKKKARSDSDSSSDEEDDDDDDEGSSDDEGWDTDETGSDVTHSEADPADAAERAAEAKKDK